MYENNVFINYGIIYDTTYVCSQQYRCANVMWLFSVLEFTYKVIINKLINSPVHVRSKIDAIDGY